MTARAKGLWLVCGMAMAGQTATSAESAHPLIEFDGIPISCAVSNLARQANLNYILDPRASSASIRHNKWVMPEIAVTCFWTNSAPVDALSDLLRLYNLKMVTNGVTSVARIVSVAQSSEPIPASEIKAETNSIIPVVLLENVPLAVIINELGKKAQLTISVDPRLPIPSSGPELTVATSIISVHWENIRPRQALVALLDACDLTMIEQSGGSSAMIISKQFALLSRPQSILQNRQ